MSKPKAPELADWEIQLTGHGRDETLVIRGGLLHLRDGAIVLTSTGGHILFVSQLAYVRYARHLEPGEARNVPPAPAQSAPPPDPVSAPEPEPVPARPSPAGRIPAPPAAEPSLPRRAARKTR